MNIKKRILAGLIALTIGGVTIAGCGSSEGGAPTETVGVHEEESIMGTEAGANQAATPTPTKGAVQAGNPCQGVSGGIEMQVLVGPAEAAGLEPIAVGEMPFSVVNEEPPYQVEGGGQIAYAETLTKEWGTYKVTLEMDSNMSGECEVGPEGPALHTQIVMSGEQMVEVNAGEFQAEYPWSGEHSFDLNFPLEEGATAMGEGWAFVLHLE